MMVEENRTERPAANRPVQPRQKRGVLTIFLGMTSGVGKTYAMLQSAREEKIAGRDVVIGQIDTHASKAMETLVRGLTVIPGRQIHPGGRNETQLDVDAILARGPHVVLIDDLARSNSEGSRHAKRFQDAREILEAGIDVYATINLQNIASQAEGVERITGTAVHELIPDSVLDGAEIRMVDLHPVKSARRVRDHMAKLSQNPKFNEIKFLSEAALMGLRELTWRFVAGRTTREVDSYLRANQISGPWKSGQRLMAALRPGDDCMQIVRRSFALAEASNSPWIVVYVERHRLSEQERLKLTAGLALASEMGAEIITTTDEDVTAALLRVAAQRNVTQIVIGSGSQSFGNDRLTRRLVRECGDIDVHVVGATLENSRRPIRSWLKFPGDAVAQYGIALGLVGIITLFAYHFRPVMGGPHAAALIYLLAVVVLGSFARRGPTLLAATLSAVLWDYFILPPVHEFWLRSPEDALLLGMYFVVALIVGQLSTRIRSQQTAEHLREERATALYLLTRELNEATTVDHIVERAVQQMENAFKSQIIVAFADGSAEPGYSIHKSSTCDATPDEKGAASWVLKHGQRAGRFTTNIPHAGAHFIPLVTSAGVIGAVGLRLGRSLPPTIQQFNLLDGFGQQIAYALDRQRLREVSENAKLLAESERLSKTLLNSMSHEIRTPIAIISSAVSYLTNPHEPERSEAEKSALAAIHDATQRLNRLVGNVFDITRLESGHVRPKTTLCDIKELVHLAVTQTEGELRLHDVDVQVAPGLPLVPVDFVLMEHALTNLLSNAAVHTAPGTRVHIGTRAEGDFLIIEVADRGPGIPPDSLGRVFDKFYRGPQAPTGGTGLGLSLVKGFVEAQGGRVTAENRPGGGAVFAIRLPIGNTSPVPAETET